MSDILQGVHGRFDAIVTPKWVMVPYKKSTALYLRDSHRAEVRGGSTENISVTSRPSDKKKGFSLVTVSGLKAGRARLTLIAKSSNTVFEEVDVDVLAEQKMTMAACLVKDVNNQGTSLNKATVAMVLNNAHHFMLEQLNVRTTVVSIEDLKVYRDLGAVLEADLLEGDKVVDTAAPSWWGRIMMMTPRFKVAFPRYSSDVVLLFTQKIATYCGPEGVCAANSIGGYYKNNSNFCFIADGPVSRMDEVVVHELGHFVGNEHSCHTDRMMYWRQQTRRSVKGRKDKEEEEEVTNTSFGRDEVRKFHRRGGWRATLKLKEGECKP